MNSSRGTVGVVVGLLACMIASAVFAADAARNWPVYLGDAQGTHYSRLNQINRDKV